MPVIGYAPVLHDVNTGQVYVDTNEIVGSADDDEGGALSPKEARQYGRLTKRKARKGQLSQRNERRLAALEAKIDEDDDDIEEGASMDRTPADVYQAAAASGMVIENQYDGLGSTLLAPSGNGFIVDTLNRHLWIKSLVCSSDAPDQVEVTAISLAGLPINVGGKGTPLQMFAHDTTRFGISFGRRLGLVGQSFRVDLHNIDAGTPHTVSGGVIGDEVSPYGMQRWMEWMILQAASQGFAIGF